MSGTFAIALTVLIFASNWACYRLGQMSILEKFRRHHERRKERELRWREFEDFED